MNGGEIIILKPFWKLFREQLTVYLDYTPIKMKSFLEIRRGEL